MFAKWSTPIKEKKPQRSKTNGSEHRPIRTLVPPLTASLSCLYMLIGNTTGGGPPSTKGSLPNIWNLGSRPHI